MPDTASSEKYTIIPIFPEFHEFIPPAILRLRYIFPDVEIKPAPEGVKVIGTIEVDGSQLEREVNYQIYREKIFQNTLSLRQSLYQMLAT